MSEVATAPTVDITIEELKEWLEDLPNGMAIGRKRICRMCPLAYFLACKFKVAAAVLEDGSCILGDRRFLLPKWTTTFIEAIDTATLPDYRWNGWIKKEEALRVLSSLHPLKTSS